MYNNYAVVFQNGDTKKVFMDIYYAKSASDARHCFNECRRHGNLIILSVTEIPD